MVVCVPFAAASAGAGAGSAGVHAARPSCGGGARTAVATLRDPAAAQVPLDPRDTTVSSLRRLRPPQALGAARVPGVETTAFRVTVRLLAAQVEGGGTIRLVVSDPITGGSMTATLPSPVCVPKANPAVAAKMLAARASFVGVCGDPPATFQQLRGQATITGVGFFNPAGDQPGEAPGRIELTPVLSLTSVGCRSGPATGLDGVVRRRPISPLCVIGILCSHPVAGVTLTFSAEGQILARTRSAADGSYRIELAPGIYSVGVEPATGALVGSPRPSRVRVNDQGVSRIDFLFATGIRPPKPLARSKLPRHRDKFDIASLSITT